MPERPEDFELEWARIVEELTSDGASAAPAGTLPGAPSGAGDDQAADARPGQRAPDPEPIPSPDPAAFLDTWADEGHYVPPPPPGLPVGTPVKRLAWAGMLAGPAILGLIAVTGWQAPTMVPWAAGLATLAGFVTLVWQLPDARSDGWDDGARV